MREKRNAIINFSIELSQRRLYLAGGCGSSLPHSGVRHNPFSSAKICRLMIFGAVCCMMFAAPAVAQTSEIFLHDKSLLRKSVVKDVPSVTNQAGSNGPASGKTNPAKAAPKRPDPDHRKSTKYPKKGSSNPYSVKTLLAGYQTPLLEPKSDLATPLSGPQSPKTVKLFKRLYYHGKRMDRYQGRQFIAEGEAYHSKALPKDYFMLFRWQIDCCTGEVEPVGIIVRGSLSNSANNANWVNVDGYLEIIEIDGFRLPCLAATEVKKIPTPSPEKQFISF